MPTTVTARDFVTRGLKLLGVVGSADTPSGEDIADGFVILNEWMDFIKTNRKTIFQVGRNVHNLVGNQQAYTIGDGGDFNQERPLWIEGWGILPSPSDTKPQEIPMGRPMTLAQWRKLSVKGTTGQYPTSLYYDYRWTAGLGRVEVYPVPTSSTPDIVLYTPSPLSEFADLTTPYSFPPGYRLYIRTGFALQAAAEWDVDDERKLARITRMHKEAEGFIKRANWRPVDAGFDPALTGIGLRARNIYDLS